MVSGQGINKGPAMAHAVTSESRYFRLASNIIDPISPTRLKSLINRDTKKDVCTWRDPLLGLNLLQIAVNADNVRAVEELIARGANVEVTLSQQRMAQWTLEDTPCTLSLYSAAKLWHMKMHNLCIMQLAPEAVHTSHFGLIHLAAFGGSSGTVRYLVSKGHAYVNEPAAKSGLTPLMCSALCRTFPNKGTLRTESMRTVLDVLLELGGDLGRVDTVGNDIMAIAASAWDRGLWKDIIKDPVLLSLCTAKHAGLVALQLFATWICPKTRPTKAAEGQVATVWCAEMSTISDVWCAELSETTACERALTLRAELSEPVSQRVLRPEAGTREGWSSHCQIFWPYKGDASTNVLCAIMQGTGVPPEPVELTLDERRTMLRRLFSMGVQPEALLLPGRPDPGRCRLCHPDSLMALIDILIERCSGDLSRHKEVLMDQLWCLFYTCAKHPMVEYFPNGSLKHVEEACQILSTLHTHGVDWTDPSAWPEDCVDGTWRRQFPVPFLLEHVDSETSSSMTLLVALCRELMALDDEDFVNAHHPDQTSPMVQAARGGHAYAVLSMYACGGCPVEQGSDWIVFLRAATSTFSPRMAHVVHLIFRNMPSIIPVEHDPDDPDDNPEVWQIMTAYLAGNHPGYEALLLPMMEATPRADLLYRQCQLALQAPKSDMGAVLKLLLDVEVEGEEDPSSDQEDKDFSKHPVVAALQFRDPKSGLTLLGQAMTWGYDGAIPPLLDVVRAYTVPLLPLLDCSLEKTKHYKPLFAAVIRGDDKNVSNLLQLMSFHQALHPPALLEHVVMGRAGRGRAPRPARSPSFVAEPGRGAETIDLLMCAASVGCASTVQALIDCGIDPQDRRHFGGNRYYKSAVHAAVEFPDLAMLKRKGGKSASQALDGVKGLLPGVNQMRCVTILLKGGAAVTERQLTIITRAILTLEDPKDVTGRRQPSADRTLHAGGALDMASADEACLRMRLLRPARLLIPLPALQDHLILQCQVSVEPLAPAQGDLPDMKSPKPSLRAALSQDWWIQTPSTLTVKKMNGPPCKAVNCTPQYGCAAGSNRLG